MDFLSFKDVADFFKYFYIDFSNLWSVISAILDISLVAYLIYIFIKLIRETRAWQLLKGIIIIILVGQLSKIFGFKTLSYILDNVLAVAAIALVIIFQPELRSVLEKIGRSNMTPVFLAEDEDNRIRITAMIEEIVGACIQFSEKYTGALIVVERKTKVGDIIKTGIPIDSIISKELIINIFSPNTPLHDGAIIIRDNKIIAASCYLPLSDNPDLSKELGTRHRAALGITEVSDSIAIVVSEESGKISFAVNGGMTRNLTSDTLRNALNKNLIKEKQQTRKKKLTLKGKWEVGNDKKQYRP